MQRPRDHINRILRLDEDIKDKNTRTNAVATILKELKKLIENAVRSLETIFKYNDVSNRNFGGTDLNTFIQKKKIITAR